MSESTVKEVYPSPEWITKNAKYNSLEAYQKQHQYSIEHNEDFGIK